MGRNKKNHEPIEDTFDNVLDDILKIDIESKRIKKDDTDKIIQKKKEK